MVQIVLFQCDPRPFGMVNHAHLAPFDQSYWPKGANRVVGAAKMADFGPPKWLQTPFAKSDPGQSGMVKEAMLG